MRQERRGEERRWMGSEVEEGGGNYKEKNRKEQWRVGRRDAREINAYHYPPFLLLLFFGRMKFLFFFFSSLFEKFILFGKSLY